MAVSSTGFAAGAITTAADAGIALRELQSLTYDDVVSMDAGNRRNLNGSTCRSSPS